MDRARLGRNVLFSLIILIVVFSIGRADLPATHRVEEYIAYVLSTEFDYAGWLGDPQGRGLAGGLEALRAWAPRLFGGRGETDAAPATTGGAAVAGAPGGVGGPDGPRGLDGSGRSDSPGGLSDPTGSVSPGGPSGAGIPGGPGRPGGSG